MILSEIGSLFVYFDLNQIRVENVDGFLSFVNINDVVDLILCVVFVNINSVSGEGIGIQFNFEYDN